MIENEHYTASLTKCPITDKMREDIQSFKEKFQLKYRITPYVSINTKRSYIGELSMSELLELVNRKMTERYERKTASILDHTRKRPIIIYRQVFCKMAMSLGYGPTAIASFIKKNHATVIHAVNLIDNLIDTGNVEMISCVNEMYAEIESYISNKEYEKVI
jgi:chromosomal replication initiation ATPase DnaA